MGKGKPPCRRLSRREFLISSATALAGVALGCGRRREGAPVSTQPPQPTPTAMPRAMVTPVPTRPPTATPIPTAPPERAADLLLYNGKVITVDTADTVAQAIALKDGQIQAVGMDNDLVALVGQATQMLDLQGRAVTPGLIDAHNHLWVMGLLGPYYTPFIPPEVKTLAELQAGLAEALAKLPKGEWLLGYFLAISEGRLPNKYDLDPISPDHPVWIMQQGGHYGSANSLAMKMAGITAATKDPTGGIIERDKDGEPTGVFYNHRAMDLLRRSAPRYTMQMVRDNLISVQPLFAACGVTSIHDNNVRGLDPLQAYLDLGKNGQMMLRNAVYYTLEWPQDLDVALKQVERYQDDYLRLAGFKFLIDGQAKMAYCHQPHTGMSWDMPTWEPRSFKQTVRALHDTGLQISVHCFGDAAVDLALDAFEDAMNANPRPDPRHRLEHVILCTPEATQRMGDLGVVVCAQPQFLKVGGDHYLSVLGDEREPRIIVTREWLDNGVHLALGSDAPTTPWYTPQVTLAASTARVTPSNKTVGQEQRLTVQEALRAHTIGAAYAVHEEKAKGSLEVGKLADVVVWHEDPYTTPPLRLWQTTIDMTIIGGKVVYQA